MNAGDGDGNVGRSGQSVRTVALAVTAGVFLGGVATGVAFPTLPLLDRYLGISAVMLGVVLSANRLARLVMNTPAGGIIDEYGARTPMVLGLFVQGLAPFGYVAGLHTPPVEVAVLPVVGSVSAPAVVFVVARLLWGVGSAFVFVGAFAVVTHVTTENNRGRWTGYMRAGQSLGFPTGLVVGGLLADVFDIQTAFLTAGVLALSAGVIGFRVLPAISPDPGQRGSLRDLPGTVRDRPAVLPVGLANGGLRLLFGGILLTTAVKYAADIQTHPLGLTATGVSGLVMGVGVVASSGATAMSGRYSDELDTRAAVVVPAFAVLAVGFATLAMAPSLAGLVAGVVLVGIGTGGAAPALLATLGDLSPADEVGKLGGVYNVFGDVGLAVGPLLALPAVDSIGFQPTYLLAAALAAACLLLVHVTLITHD